METHKEEAGISHGCISTFSLSTKKKPIKKGDKTWEDERGGWLRKTLSKGRQKRRETANDVPVGKQTPAAAADHSKIPEGKLKIADMSHTDTGGQSF